MYGQDKYLTTTKTKQSLECIDAMRIIFGDDAVVSFCICNAFYIYLALEV
jgi:hypothetical protein